MRWRSVFVRLLCVVDGYHTCVIAWIIAAPVCFLALLLVLEQLERRIVDPPDRAAKILRMLERSSPDELERQVARFLDPLIARRTLSPGVSERSSPSTARQ